MSTTDIILDEVSELISDEEFDAGLNELAMKGLGFMNDTAAAMENIPARERISMMAGATKAMLFNILMAISEENELDPQALVDQAYQELSSAVESVSGGGCCGGDHHHH